MEGSPVFLFPTITVSESPSKEMIKVWRDMHGVES